MPRRKASGGLKDIYRRIRKKTPPSTRIQRDKRRKILARGERRDRDKELGGRDDDVS